ncbi:MAG: dienelactone hydrolase family protein [Methylococcaceae bacterium]|nr:dienelactone hydrolase family protein [Methylococcaceae bacterium]
MALQSTTVEYFDQGTCLEGFFAHDDRASKPLPAVLIAHAWGGRDEFVCDKARELAGLGYAAFALDMYGNGVLGGSVAENSALMTPFMEDRILLQRRMTAALDAVRNQDPVNPHKVAAMGFCFGGLCVLDLARTGADLCGVVSFHGLLGAPGNTPGNTIKARVLVLHGHDDPMVPADDVRLLQDELTRAGSDWQFHVFGNTMHAFTNPVANDPGFGTVYQPLADTRSWQMMRSFFEECFEDR